MTSGSFGWEGGTTSADVCLGMSSGLLVRTCVYVCPVCIGRVTVLEVRNLCKRPARRLVAGVPTLIRAHANCYYGTVDRHRNQLSTKPALTYGQLVMVHSRCLRNKNTIRGRLAC